MKIEYYLNRMLFNFDTNCQYGFNFWIQFSKLVNFQENIAFIKVMSF